MNLDAIHPEFFWDVRVQRYRYRDTKRFAPKEAVMDLQVQYVAEQSTLMRGVASRLYSGEISLRQAQLEAAGHLKAIHLSYGFLGQEGTENMSAEDFLRIGRTLKRQYNGGIDPATGKRFGLSELFKDIAAGRVSGKMAAHRLGLFAQGGKDTYWESADLRLRQKGAIQMRRFLHSQDECADCAAYAAQGRVGIGVLPLPTQRCECMNNCKCSVTYYDSKGGIMPLSAFSLAVLRS
jgi:hypothetical protein